MEKLLFTQKRVSLIVLLLFFSFTCTYSQSLRFTDTTYVNLGNDPALKLTNFTLETWLKIEGFGSTTETGNGGFPGVIPIITEERAENESPAVDVNYFMALQLVTTAGGGYKIVPDFEDNTGINTPPNFPASSAGLNHEAIDVSAIPNNVWTQVAATYGAGTWNLYINGVLDKSESEGAAVTANTSIQHTSVESAIRSYGIPAGFFNEKIDEVRIWNIALPAADIPANYQSKITSSAGLLGRFGFNENCDTIINNSVAAGVNGIAKSFHGTSPTVTVIHPTNGGTSWVGRDYNNLPPNAPSNPNPANNGTSTSTSPNICADVSDPNGDNLRVRFYGRLKPAGSTSNFTIAFLPDTQFYTEEPQGANSTGGNAAMFNAQTAWIASNRVAKNIVYVGHLGDCVQNGDNPPGVVEDIEWQRAVTAMNTIESPALTGLPEGIPYGICVGNHDQTPFGNPLGTTNYYNQFFGISHFTGRSYYGGHHGANNDNHYQMFSTSGIDFLVISLEYDPTGGFAAPGGALDWAAGLVQAHSGRKVIVMSHWMINQSGAFSTQGQALFDRLSPYTNVIMFKCGHISSATGGEYTRTDLVGGRNIYTILTDYQSRIGGGSGLLRTYEFNPIANTVSAKTYSPYTLTSETDANSEFTLPIDLNPFTLMGETLSASGTTACVTWPNLTDGLQYEWYAEVYDGVNATTGPVWTFIAFVSGPLAVSMLDLSAHIVDKQVNVTWATANELDNRHFEIERSKDGIRFDKIGITNSKGNSTFTQRYIFMDINPFAGKSFYRLKQVDLDGQFKYSNVVSVLNNDSKKGIDIYPNPAGPTFTISIQNKYSGTVLVNMLDLTGRQVYYKKMPAYNGIIEVKHPLPAGMYNVGIIKDEMYLRKNIIIK